MSTLRVWFGRKDISVGTTLFPRELQEVPQ
jgi:hypothetical protein